MAVRENENRRVGGGAEKLLTLEETARRLGLPADDVEAMIRAGQLPAFRLGGSFLRIRQKDVESMYARMKKKRVPAQPERPPLPEEPRSAEIAPMPNLSKASAWERLADFFYFNDFYLLAVLIILTLLAIIVIF